MASQLASRLGSSIIELVAEDGCQSFFVHRDLLTAQSTITSAPPSQPLDLRCWYSETVEHLVTFLYLGAYDVTHPEPYDGMEASPDNTTTATHSGASTPDTERSAEQASATRSAFLGVPNENTNNDPDPAVPEHLYQLHYPQATHDYSHVLFEHARVYTLAQHLCMDGLRMFAYRRFSAILDGMNKIARSDLAHSVVEMLGYVYAHVRAAGDPLRDRVSRFAALNFQMLYCTDEMRHLLRERPEVAVELLVKVHARLLAAEDALEKATAMPASETERSQAQEAYVPMRGSIRSSEFRRFPNPFPRR